jgi:biopolymer transport protein ExbD
MVKHQKKKNLIAEINITPFTDVILVLLVIFMIATPLIMQSTIQVNLPESKSTQPTENQRPAYLTIAANGSTYLDNEPVTKKDLEQKMALRHKNNPDMVVVLRADKSVRFNYVVDAIDVLTGLNIKKLDIAAIKEEQ